MKKKKPPIKKKPDPIIVIKKVNKKSFISNNWLIVLAVTLFAFILRIYGAGRFSFWFDEFLHIIPSTEFISGNGLYHIDGINGLITTYVEIVFLFLFGSSELAGRLPMALFSASTIPVLYILTKKLFNNKVAIITIVFFAISLYMIFWGRVVRNYAVFLPFYLLLCYQLINFLEPSIATLKNNINKVSFTWKWLGLTFLILILSVFNHPLTIFIVFAFAFYGSSIWIINLFGKNSTHRFFNKYTPFLVALGLVIFMLTKHGNVFFKNFLQLFLPPNMLEFIVPDIKRLTQLWNEKPFEAIEFYFNVLQTDMSYVWVLAIVGLIAGVRNYTKGSLFSFGQFGFIFLLLSLVFREGTVTRYLYFIYPFYLMLAAYGIVFIIQFISNNVIKKPQLNDSSYSKVIIIILILILSKPQSTKAFLTRTEHGQVVDKKISEWYYTNWKEAAEYVKLNRVEGDVVLSTVPNAVRFYLGLDTSVVGWFRQMRYDGTVKEYVQNEPSGKKVSGYTTEEFIATVENHPRGWLLADYYFNNVMTDPQARNYAIQNLDFHFGASKDGSVQVFSWDHSKKRQYPVSVLIELGKSLGTQVSGELDFNFRPTPGIAQFNMYLILEGYDVDGEGYVNLNGKGWTPVPKSDNARGWGAEQTMVPFDVSAFNDGSNKVQFTYNPDIGPADVRKGFVIYSVNIGR